MNRKLKITLIILVMILICTIGFGGIYVKKKNGIFKNLLPDYEYGTKLEGTRIATLKAVENDEEDETIELNENSDEEETESEDIQDSEDENEEVEETEEISNDADNSDKTEKYKEVKDIIIKRLKTLGISNYEVRLDEETGDISVELNDNKNTDEILADLTVTGKFEVIDTDDETVLMDTNDIKSANVLYNNTSSGITVYLDILFTKEGTKKFEQITTDYTVIDEDDEETETDELDETDIEENDEEEEEEEEKTITINIDGEKFLSTSFNNTISNGELTVTVGSASKDTDTVTENITAAQRYATILNNGELPLEYNLESSEYIKSIYLDNMYLYVVLAILGGIAILSIIYMIIRYRTYGLLSSIVYIATIALITIIARYTEIQINIETIISTIIALIIIDYINFKVLRSINKEDRTDEIEIKIKQAYKKIIDVMVIALIPAIVLTYNSLSKLSNIGMTLFWMVIIVLIMNLLFTRKILLTKIQSKN